MQFEYSDLTKLVVTPFRWGWSSASQNPQPGPVLARDREDADRGAGAQAACGAMEICDRWCRHRGSRDERRLTIGADRFSNLPEPDQFWRIRVDEPRIPMAWKAVRQNGLVQPSVARRKRDIGAAVTNGDRMSGWSGE